jgi:hypothetical protein
MTVSQSLSLGWDQRPFWGCLVPGAAAPSFVVESWGWLVESGRTQRGVTVVSEEAQADLLLPPARLSHS